MSELKDRLINMINRHRAAFCISLTLFLIGLFAGIFYTAGACSDEGELIANIEVAPSFWRILFTTLFANLALVAVIYAGGLFRIGACAIAPAAVIFKGYGIGSLIVSSIDSLGGLIQTVIAVIPFSAVISAVTVLGGMGAMSMAGVNACPGRESYKSFFLLLLLLTLVACLYYAIIIYIFNRG